MDHEIEGEDQEKVVLGDSQERAGDGQGGKEKRNEQDDGDGSPRPEAHPEEDVMEVIPVSTKGTPPICDPLHDHCQRVGDGHSEYKQGNDGSHKALSALRYRDGYESSREPEEEAARVAQDENWLL